ncbi:MAG: chloride channel protein [Ilumatobacteraceae bacterium]
MSASGVGGAVTGRAAGVARRFHLTVVLSAVIGVVTGLCVAGFDVTVKSALEHVLDQPLWVVMLVPSVGLVAANLVGMRWGGGDTATTDAYMRAYHQRGGRMPLRALWPKAIGSALTLGAGNAFGFEGPSILIGGTIGSAVEERFGGQSRRDDAKVLMVAGAAAGVAAVFKAPLTGVVFALEVPYRSDVARRSLLPSLVAAGSSYVTFAALVGTEPLLPTGGAAPFDLRDLGGGLLLGLACGVLARLGAMAINRAKRLTWPRRWRIGIACVLLAGLAPLGQWWFGGPYQFGPSYATIAWATAADRTVLVLVALFAMRAVATWLGVAAGGMGGLFIPLVTQGAVVGAICQQLVHAPNAYLFPTIGIAALLGAGYRTPLAGVAFVAEATGQPGFLVPALLAAAASQLTMGRHSFSTYQRQERSPDLTALDQLAVADVMSPNADTIDVTLTLDQVVPTMMNQNRRWAPAVDDGRYVGLLALADIATVPVADWPTSTAGDLARRDVPPVAPDTPLTTVAERLPASGGRGRDHRRRARPRRPHLTRRRQRRRPPRPPEEPDDLTAGWPLSSAAPPPPGSGRSGRRGRGVAARPAHSPPVNRSGR